MTVLRLQDPATTPRRRASDRPALVPAPRAGTATGDRRLLRAVALGDAAAWGALVDAHADQLWSRARHAGLSPQAAEDACELVWLRLAQAVPDLPAEPLRVWLQRELDDQVDSAQRRSHRSNAHAPARAMRTEECG